jgi:hypothetical protein
MASGDSGRSRNDARRCYVSELFWPGATAAEADAAIERLRIGCEEATAAGEPVALLGAMLVIEDEDLLCRLEGSIAAIEAAFGRAGVGYDRLMPAVAFDV